ncbi:MAG: hypothetical protein JWO05_2507 [Gemmatimonadetes bacterium]|nr:hypothetical protein [Gemmatimonadota bacterium]
MSAYAVGKLLGFLIACALVAWAGPKVSLRLFGRGGMERTNSAQSIGCLAGGLLALTVLMLTICSGPDAGGGPFAERDFELARPMIYALGKYHAREKHYPPSLREIVGHDIWSIPRVEDDPYFHPLEYRVQGDAYMLSFRYGGQKPTVCDYRSRAKLWSCRRLDPPADGPGWIAVPKP